MYYNITWKTRVDANIRIIENYECNYCPTLYVLIRQVGNMKHTSQSLRGLSDVCSATLL